MELILYVLILFVSSSAAVLENLFGSKGSSYTFVCPYRKTPTDNVIWTFTNKSGILFPVSEGIFLPSGNPARNRTEIVGNHSIGEYNLKLSGLLETDEGTYKCLVSNEEKEYYLELLAAPSALVLYDIVDNKIRGTEGKSLNINCTAIGGKPPPDIRLEVDSQIVSGKQSVQYTIPVLQRNHDKQLVKCQATSEALVAAMAETAFFYLYLKPSVPVFNKDPPRTNDTQPLVVTCTSTGGRPAGLIYWKVNSNPVTVGVVQQNSSDPTTDTYIVVSTLTYSVDRSYDGQSITCGITHQTLSQPIEAAKTISVYYAPDITVSNKTRIQTDTTRTIQCIHDDAPDISVSNKTHIQNDTTRTIQCNAVGNPTIYTYNKWQHKSLYGELIRELDGGQDGILTLPSVAESNRYRDSGEYICTVKNGIGDRYGMIQQTGYGYLTVNAQPVFTLDNDDITTQYGEFGTTTDIHVYVYSDPKYTQVTWYKGKVVLSPNDKYGMTKMPALVVSIFHGVTVQLDGFQVKLVINNSVKGDFTTYKVRLSNGYGQLVEHSVVLESASMPENTDSQTSTSAIIGGVAGGILVLTVIIIVLVYYVRTRGSVYRGQNKKSQRTEDAVYQNQLTTEMYEQIDGATNENEDNSQNINKDDSPQKTYEPLNMRDNRDMYAELSDRQDTSQSKTEDESSKKTYEPLDIKDNPNLYAELTDQEGQRQQYNTSEHYEAIGARNKPNVYEDLQNKNGIKEKECVNMTF